MPRQLSLSLQLPASARFDNYVASENGAAYNAVQQLVAAQEAASLYLAGAAGTGKTHLLQAACRSVQACGQQAAYLPLAELARLSPALLEGLEDFTLLALDDLQGCAGQAEWEEAIFHLYNRTRAAGGRLLFAAREAPERLPLALADLRSRLSWGGVFALQMPSDETRCQILIQHAAERGLELSDDSATYLLRRCTRDLPSLLQVLERLDQAALNAQRRLTVPFIRSTLGLAVDTTP